MLSFHLSQMLGIDAVPAVVLQQVNFSSPQWSGHEVTEAGWKDGKAVAMIQWVDGLNAER